MMSKIRLAKPPTGAATGCGSSKYSFCVLVWPTTKTSFSGSDRRRPTVIEVPRSVFSLCRPPEDRRCSLASFCDLNAAPMNTVWLTQWVFQLQGVCAYINHNDQICSEPEVSRTHTCSRLMQFCSRCGKRSSSTEVGLGFALSTSDSANHIGCSECVAETDLVCRGGGRSKLPRIGAIAAPNKNHAKLACFKANKEEPLTHRIAMT